MVNSYCVCSKVEMEDAADGMKFCIAGEEEGVWRKMYQMPWRSKLQVEFLPVECSRMVIISELGWTIF
jgi:hypothetical protein